MGLTSASCRARRHIYGVCRAPVSAGSNHVGARVMCIAHVICPVGGLGWASARWRTGHPCQVAQPATPPRACCSTRRRVQTSGRGDGAVIAVPPTGCRERGMRSTSVRRRSASRRDEGHPCRWSVREARREEKTRPTIFCRAGQGARWPTSRPRRPPRPRRCPGGASAARHGTAPPALLRTAGRAPGGGAPRPDTRGHGTHAADKGVHAARFATV